ncbi:MAG: VOC family protein [Alphaproteobacteria bacterium]
MSDHQGKALFSGDLGMLHDAKLVGFIATTNPDKAHHFYGDLLGLPLIEETPVALVFQCANAELRVAIAPPFEPLPFTAAGWQVTDIEAKADALTDAGVEPERFPGMEYSERGIWTAPGGAKVMWVKDPEGNLLSLTE